MKTAFEEGMKTVSAKGPLALHQVISEGRKVAWGSIEETVIGGSPHRIERESHNS